MLKRCTSLETLEKGVANYKDVLGDVSLEYWMSLPNNRMYEKDGDIGLATYEYPGVYTVHWFFTKARGRQAINLAKEMLAALFAEGNAQAIRGLTRVDLRGARWASRQVGMTSYGLITIDGKDYELFCMTKKDFNNG